MHCSGGKGVGVGGCGCGICVAELENQYNESLTLKLLLPSCLSGPLSPPSGPLFSLTRTRREAQNSCENLSTLIEPASSWTAAGLEVGAEESNDRESFSQLVSLFGKARHKSMSGEVRDQSFSLLEQTMTDSELLPKNCTSS